MKITEKIKDKFKSTKKGIVYLFIEEANNIAALNQYQGFEDIGLKTPENYVNQKIDEIYKKGSGPFFGNDYKGFDEVLQSALSARDSILKGDYNDSVIKFIKAAIKSYVPTSIKPKSVEIDAKTLLAIAKENDRPEKTVIEKVKKVREVKEKFSTEGLGMLLSDEEEGEEELEDDSSEGVGSLL